jgi:hypothetical protein
METPLGGVSLTRAVYVRAAARLVESRQPTIAEDPGTAPHGATTKPDSAMTVPDDADEPRLDPNDPYRYGLPDRPPPPEFAPPGWTPPPGYYLPPQPPTPPQGPYSPQGPYAPQGHYGPPPGWSPPPPPYGPPFGNQYGPPQPWDQREPGRGKAITALVLGIASIPLCVLSFLDLLLVMAAVAFGATALADHLPGRPSPGRSLARAGLICAAVGGVLAIVVTVAVIVKFRNDCGFGNGLGGLRGSGRSCITR